MARCAQNIVINATSAEVAQQAFWRYYPGHKPKVQPVDPSCMQGLDLVEFRDLEGAPRETTGVVFILHDGKEVFPS